MEEKDLYESGIKHFDEILKLFLEKVDDTSNVNGYKIFFPLFTYQEDKALIATFPVYIVPKEGLCTISGNVVANITEDTIKEITTVTWGVFGDEIKSMTYEVNHELVEFMSRVIRYEHICEALKGKNETEKYDEFKNATKIALEGYEFRLERINYPIYKSTSEVCNGTSTALTENDIQQDVEKESNIEEIKEEVEITEEKSDYEKALEYMADSNSESKKYDFEWNNSNGLRYISDKTLEIAYKLIEKGEIRLEKKEKNKISIANKIGSFCHNELTTQDLHTNFFSESSKDGINKYFIKQDSTFTLEDVEMVCRGCKFEKCPKAVAAYILYLRNNGLLKQTLEDRKEFRENNNYNDYYNFVWKNQNGLKNVTQEVFDFSNALVENDAVFLNNTLNSEGHMVIKSVYSCSEYRNMNCKVSAINSDEIQLRKSKNSSKSVKRKPSIELDDICTSYDCRLLGCIYVVAAYIQYLKRSGLGNKILEDRKYYLEHKQEIDNANQTKYIEATSKRSVKDVIDFNEYIGEIENLNDLIDTIVNPYQKSLHCAIGCKYKSESDIFIEKTENLLINKKKITHKCKGKYVTRISLHNFASRALYTYTSKLKALEGDDDIKIFRDAEENITDIYKLDKNGKIISETDALCKLEILKNHLYVIDEISEFIKIYKDAEKTRADTGIRLRYERTIDFLNNLEDNDYIMLVGTQQEIDNLFNLDTRFKFVYRDSTFVIPEMTPEAMFERFTSLIKTELIDEFRKNEDKIKEDFQNYISLNREFIPLSNREIANYIATYCNIKDTLEMPANIYKKETVDEALKNIIGLENIKEKVKEFEKYVLFRLRAKADNIKLQDFNMHMIFTGNPGTGKTTIARIMAKMLFDLGIIKENKLIEVERKDLIAGWIGQTAPKTAEIIEKAVGGVLFIDEAYSLTPKSPNDFGHEAIATLIKAMEDRKDELVVVFAGYKDEMKTFIDSNPGIASRIGYQFDFKDYNVEELKNIFYMKMKNMNFIVEDDIESEIDNICSYYQKRKNFGNARFVDRLIQATIMKHSKKDGGEINRITKVDIPSIEEMNNERVIETNKTIDELFENIVGMNLLKTRIKEFSDFVKFIKDADEQGITIPEQNLHMIFTGNPGTGKTTVARIVAKILFEMGVIHENKLIEVERKDLVGEHIGETAPKTATVIEKALGGVLFIDEAYSLASKLENDLGKEAIATLIKAMEDHKGEFVVIFAGYTKEMKLFLKMNSGIASRIGYTFDFPDYTSEELIEIFKLKMQKFGFKLDDNLQITLKRICSYFCRVNNFGNGRFIDRLIQEVLMKHSQKIKNGGDIQIITLEDIPSIEELNNTNTSDTYGDTEKLLQNIIGMDELKSKIKDFASYVSFVKKAQNQNIDIPNQNMHMIFTGNPGTGKTTIARIIAKMLFDMEVIHENKLIEVERKDLVAEWIGQTAPKTAEVIERAMGGVLFIDEAYSLANVSGKDFGREAIATLIKAMEDHKGEFVVIFAGYKKEMQDFIDINPGIASRVGYTFDFKDYTAEELMQIFCKKVEKTGMVLLDDAKKNVLDVMKYFANVENIGNGRFVDRVYQETLLKCAKKMNEDITLIAKDNIPTINEITTNLFGGDRMINPNNITEESIRKTAIHELGHATVRYLLRESPNIIIIKVKAEGTGTLGHVKYDNTAQKYTNTRQTLFDDIKVSMAGMAAEQVFLNCFESGNSSDLENATNIARRIVTIFGMSDLGFVQVRNPGAEVEKDIFDEMNKILKQAFDETVSLIQTNKEKIEKVIDFLIQKGEINEEEFIREFNS